MEGNFIFFKFVFEIQLVDILTDSDEFSISLYLTKCLHRNAIVIRNWKSPEAAQCSSTILSLYG